MIPSLRQLEYIIAVADLGHFGKAAKRCGVSQPALSKQIIEAESLFGVVIFERTPTQTLPTPPGVAIIAQARRVLEEAKTLQQTALIAHTQGISGRVTLGIIPTLAPFFLPGLLSKLRQATPNALWIVHELQTLDLLSALLSGSLDCIVLASPPPDPKLSGPNLFDESFLLVTPPNHPLSPQPPSPSSPSPPSPPLLPHHLSPYPLLLLAEGHCLRDQALSFCSLSPPPEVDVRATSLPTLLSMVEASLGITLIPALAVTEKMIESQMLCFRFFQKPTPQRRVCLRWRSSSPLSESFSNLSQIFFNHSNSLANLSAHTLSTIPGFSPSSPPLTLLPSPSHLPPTI